MTRNERFARSMHSLDWKEQGIDQARSRLRSDEGLGVERLVEAIDYTREVAAAEAKAEAERAHERYQLTINFIAALIAAGAGFSAPTLLKIIENGNNRQASIAQIIAETKLPYKQAEFTYFRHRKVISQYL